MTRRNAFVKLSDVSALEHRYERYEETKRITPPKLPRTPVFRLPAISQLFHAVGEKLDICPYEIQAYYGAMLADKNPEGPPPAVVNAFITLLTALKLSYSPPIAEIRATVSKAKEDYEKESNKYTDSKDHYDRFTKNQKERLAENHDSVIRQWNRMIASMKKMLDENNHLSTISDEDQMFISALARAFNHKHIGIVSYNQGYVFIRWDILFTLDVTGKNLFEIKNMVNEVFRINKSHQARNK